MEFGREIRLRLVLLIFFILLFSTSAMSAPGCKAVYGDGTHQIILATGSPGELGLLKVLCDTFNRNHDTRICWIKAGSGKSLKLLKARKVDLIMVHAPEAEKSAIKEGWAINRTLIGSNEFYIVGPRDDPANITSAKSVVEAYKRIAKAKAKFFSRGDNSGTNKKELAIWKMTGITQKKQWYIITKDFMMATLMRADREKGYFMTDSSTWVVARKKIKNLKVLFRGDSYLINVYHALCQPHRTTPGQPYAMEFIRFVASPKGQFILRTYGKDRYGEPLYHDAKYARQYER